MVKNVIEVTCPRRRKLRRTVYGTAPVTIRCSCGCGWVFQFKP